MAAESPRGKRDRNADKQRTFLYIAVGGLVQVLRVPARGSNGKSVFFRFNASGWARTGGIAEMRDEWRMSGGVFALDLGWRMEQDDR